MHSSLHELAFHANFSDSWIHQKDNQEIFFILTNINGNLVLPYLFYAAYRIAFGVITRFCCFKKEQRGVKKVKSSKFINTRS